MAASALKCCSTEENTTKKKHQKWKNNLKPAVWRAGGEYLLVICMAAHTRIYACVFICAYLLNFNPLNFPMMTPLHFGRFNRRHEHTHTHTPSCVAIDYCCYYCIRMPFFPAYPDSHLPRCHAAAAPAAAILFIWRFPFPCWLLRDCRSPHCALCFNSAANICMYGWSHFWQSKCAMYRLSGCRAVYFICLHLCPRGWLAGSAGRLCIHSILFGRKVKVYFLVIRMKILLFVCVANFVTISYLYL